MRAISAILTLAAVAMTAAACGGGSSSTSAHRSKAAGAALGAPLRTYRVVLSGRGEPRGGARNGRGDAVIAIHTGSVVCFRFAHLHGFSGATTARIHSGAEGKTGKVVLSLSTAPSLHHEGCVHASPAAVSAIERKPHDHYVTIHSTQYPKGAVRGQL